MKGGRPKNDPSQAPTRPRPDSQVADLIQPIPAAKRTRANTQARQSHKRGFMGLLLADPRLDDADRKAIKNAAENGMTTADIAALVAYELRLAQKFHADQSLSSKDLIVALTKIASQAAAAAQLAAANTAQNLPSRLEVSFMQGGALATTDPILGDPLVTE